MFEDGISLNSVADAVEGVQTGRNLQWVRFFWETEDNGEKEWVCFLKGGGYRKWAGLDSNVLRWRGDGSALAATPGATLRNPNRYFTKGLSYTDFASGCLGVRFMTGDEVFDLGAPSVFPKPDSDTSLPALACILNSRVASALIRSLSPNPQHIRTGYLNLLPLPTRGLSRQVGEAVSCSVRCRATIERLTNVLSRDYDPSSGLDELSELRLQAVLATSDGLLEQMALSAYDLPEEDISSILAELSTPAGDHPLIAGYDMLEATGFGVANALTGHPREELAADELSELKRKVRSMYESGDGSETKLDDEEAVTSDENDQDDSVAASSVPIPPETLVERIAQETHVHPVSVYKLLEEGIGREGWTCVARRRRKMLDRLSVIICRLIGHRWPRQVESGEPLPDWASVRGIIPLTDGMGASLFQLLRERIAAEFESRDSAIIEREFAEVMGVAVEQWVTHEFFAHHVSQFKKRPIAWHVQSGTFSARRQPAFSSLVHYHKLTSQTLTTLQSQYLRPLRQRYETEMRGIESLPLNARSERQQDRLSELMELIAELRNFDGALEAVSRTGFGPQELHSRLRQYAINDAMLCLKSRWLDKLSGVISSGPAEDWEQKGKDTGLHPNLSQWIADAIASLRHHCSAVGPKPPEAKTLEADPCAADFAGLISKNAGEMVSGSLVLACSAWWKLLDEAVFAPLRAQIKGAKDELKALKQEDPGKADRPFVRRKEIDERTKELREKMKNWQRDLDGKTKKTDNVKKHILGWRCPEAATWESWLAAQPMFDSIDSVEGIREPPRTVAEFIAQESMYAPDINDGVRVNIAPLQKAGLLAAEVLAPKDLDKAIADRAEWRSDERRWCREGKLPQLGWWPMEKHYASGQD